MNRTTPKATEHSVEYSTAQNKIQMTDLTPAKSALEYRSPTEDSSLLPNHPTLYKDRWTSATSPTLPHPLCLHAKQAEDF